MCPLAAGILTSGAAPAHTLFSEIFRFTIAIAKLFASISEEFRYRENNMTKPVTAQPTEVELQILRILWELGPSPVREIHKKLEAEKGTNYSTTVKMLSVMLDKGRVRRDEDASPHIYRAVSTREKTGKKMLSDLVEKVYAGSTMSLVLQALSSTKATREEREELRRLLDQMEAE